MWEGWYVCGAILQGKRGPRTDHWYGHTRPLVTKALLGPNGKWEGRGGASENRVLRSFVIKVSREVGQQSEVGGKGTGQERSFCILGQIGETISYGFVWRMGCLYCDGMAQQSIEYWCWMGWIQFSRRSKRGLGLQQNRKFTPKGKRTWP